MVMAGVATEVHAVASSKEASLPKGYKSSEVGVIPVDWEIDKLGDICSMKSGESITSANIDQTSKYPCYGGNGLRGFTSRYTHDGAHALIGRVGALCGNVLGVEGKFFASEHAVVVTPREGIDIRWLTNVLSEMHLNQYSESSAQPVLSVSRLSNLLLARPKTETEQQAISTVLDNAEALIRSIELLIVKKRLIKRGVMQELLTGRARLPGFCGKWSTQSLNTLGRWVGGGTPSMQRAEFWQDGTIPWASSSDVRLGSISSELRKITEKAVSESSARIVPKGSVVVVTRSGILRRFLPICIISRPTAINQDLKALIPNSPSLGKFIAHSLVYNNDNILAACLKTGTTVESIELNWLKKFEIALPPTQEEQNAVSALLSDFDFEIRALEARVSKARQIKQGMMQELLTGRVRLV